MRVSVHEENQGSSRTDRKFAVSFSQAHSQTPVAGAPNVVTLTFRPSRPLLPGNFRDLPWSSC
jgi:hypothetical protein